MQWLSKLFKKKIDIDSHLEQFGIGKYIDLACFTFCSEYFKLKFISMQIVEVYFCDEFLFYISQKIFFYDGRINNSFSRDKEMLVLLGVSKFFRKRLRQKDYHKYFCEYRNDIITVIANIIITRYEMGIITKPVSPYVINKFMHDIKKSHKIISHMTI